MSAKAAWNALGSPHTELVSQAESWARLTDRAVMIPEGELHDPMAVNEFTSWAARAVSNLANKLALTLFDPVHPAFKLDIAPAMQAKLATTLGMSSDDIEKMGSALAVVERRVMAGMAGTSLRPKLIQVLLNLIVVGTVLVDLRGDEPTLYNIREFRCRRKRSGQLIECCIALKLRKDELADEVAQLVDGEPHREVTHYQWAVRQFAGDGVTWKITQYIDDVQLPKEYTSTYTSDDAFPWAVPTWTLPIGRHYGRGLGEQCQQDLFVLAQLSEAQAKGLVAAAEIRWGVDPHGQTNIQDVQGSRSGDFIPARPQDINALGITTWQVGGLLKDAVDGLKRDLGGLFLLYQSMVRDAERVTREEIVQLVREFEGAHAGVHAHIAPTLMTPLLRFLLKREGIDLDTAKELRLRITTGFEALSRGAEIDRQLSAVQALTALATLPVPIQQRLDWRRAVDTVDRAVGSELAKQMLDENVFAQQQVDMQQAATANEMAVRQAGNK